MTTRTYTQKDGTIWEWEETPELLSILAQIHTQQNNEQQKSN